MNQSCHQLSQKISEFEKKYLSRYVSDLSKANECLETLQELKNRDKQMEEMRRKVALSTECIQIM